MESKINKTIPMPSNLPNEQFLQEQLKSSESLIYDNTEMTDLLSAVWSQNLVKMHFQQNICFQLRNWAFGITSIIIPLIWAGNLTLQTNIFLHIVAIIIIGLILIRDLSWHRFHYVYAERARLCERALLGQISTQEMTSKYYQMQYDTNSRLFRRSLNLKRLFLLQTDYVEHYLILVLLISLGVAILLT